MSGISAIGAGGVSSIWRWAPYYFNIAAMRRNAVRPAQPDTPVEPVDPVKKTAAATDTAALFPFAQKETALPTVADLNNAQDNLARMRIQYLGQDGEEALSPWGGTLDAGYTLQTGGDKGADGTRASVDGVGESGFGGKVEPRECETCKRREYQDGSNDPGVSFKTPTHISPDQAGSAVRAHEQEHVTREQAKAAREGRKVISQSVSIHTAVCPECGRVYVSGGTTRTVTAKDDSDDENEKAFGFLRVGLDPKDGDK